MSRTVETLLRNARERLEAACIPSPRAEARILMRTALDRTPEALFRDRDAPVAASEAARFLALVRRRANREPISRIMGEREFRSLPFSLAPDTLDPRPDSETVVEAALGWCSGRPGPLRALDLGTGTGCLLLAVLEARPDATGIGTDIAAGAVAAAARNAAALRLSERGSFHRTDWDTGIGGRFDLILSNPPYIPTLEIDGLETRLADRGW